MIPIGGWDAVNPMVNDDSDWTPNIDDNITIRTQEGRYHIHDHQSINHHHIIIVGNVMMIHDYMIHIPFGHEGCGHDSCVVPTIEH